MMIQQLAGLLDLANKATPNMETEIVIEHLPESSATKVSGRWRDDHSVTELLDHAGIECPPKCLYRMGPVREPVAGKPSPRPIKFEFPSRVHVRALLRSARSVRDSPSSFSRADLSRVWIRESLTREQRQKEFELRQQKRALVAQGKQVCIFDGAIVDRADLERLKREKRDKRLTLSSSNATPLSYNPNIPHNTQSN